MSTITGPAAPSSPFYIGKDLAGANSAQLNIFGTAIPNNLSTSGLTTPYSIVNPTTLFDVSSLTADHEVVVALYVSPNNIFSAVTYTADWYRDRDGALITSRSSSVAAPPSGQHWLPGTSYAAWIGWLSENPGIPTYPQYKEIQENGDYHVVISATGGESFSQTINFAVSGIPASTILSNPTGTGFDWLVRLSNYFDSSNYIEVGICTDPFTDGQSSAPTGVLASNSPPASNSGCATGGAVTGLTTNTTYTIYGYAQAADGLYYQAGSYTISLTSRPSNFSWTTAKTTGGDFNLSASEWNSFTSRIDQFRSYKNLGAYGFTTANVGDGFAAYMFNQAVNGISAMSPPTSPPSTKSTGDDIYASYLNDLVTSLNSIP